MVYPPMRRFFVEVREVVEVGAAGEVGEVGEVGEACAAGWNPPTRC